MWSFSVGPFFLCAVAYVATAYRKKEADRTGATNPDFSEAIAKMHEVDRYSDSEPSDMFTVFETDGATLAEVASPKPEACSLETLKSVLKECPTRGKICIALYKLNYPRAIGSSTLKARSILMYGQNKDAMGKALGGTFKATKVSMGFTNFVWNALKQKLQTNQVSPTLTLELADADSIDMVADAGFLWKEIKSSVGRLEASEEAALAKHVEEMIAKAAGTKVAPVVAPTQADKTSTNNNGNQGKSQPSGPAPQMPVSAPVNTAKIVKEVEEKVSKTIEDTAKKIAREEVGMAIRKLGTDIGEAARGVGKQWIDKSRGVTK